MLLEALRNTMNVLIHSELLLLVRPRKILQPTARSYNAWVQPTSRYTNGELGKIWIIDQGQALLQALRFCFCTHSAFKDIID